MTKLNNQQSAKPQINSGDTGAQSNQDGLRPQVNYAKIICKASSGQQKEEVNTKKQYPPTPAWFFTLGTKPDAWGPCPGHMLKETEK